MVGPDPRVETHPTILESAPVAQQDRQICRADIAIVVQVGRAIIAVGARAPIAQQNGQVERANTSVAVEITRIFNTVIATIKQDRDAVALEVRSGQVKRTVCPGPAILALRVVARSALPPKLLC